jgi:hypothetical protein
MIHPPGLMIEGTAVIPFAIIESCVILIIMRALSCFACESKASINSKAVYGGVNEDYANGRALP